jgi:hypothetical protein
VLSWYVSHRWLVVVLGVASIALGCLLSYVSVQSAPSSERNTQQDAQNNDQHLTADTIQGNTIVQANSIDILHVQSLPVEAKKIEK